MRLATTAAAGGAITIALFGLSAAVQAQPTVASLTWAEWAAASDFSGDDPANWTGLTVGDKTIVFVAAGDDVVIEGTPCCDAGPDITSDWGTPAGGTGNQLDDHIVTFEQLDPPNGRTYQVEFETEPGGAFDLDGIAGGTTAIQYIINIDGSTFPADDPGEFAFGFGALSIDANNPGGDPDDPTFEVVKRVTGLTPNSVTDGPVQWSLNDAFDLGVFFDDTTDAATVDDTATETVFCGSCTTWLITDYVTIFTTQTASDNVLNDITNTVTQVVPAPGALVLIGTGLLGFGVARRRMKKA